MSGVIHRYPLIIEIKGNTIMIKQLSFRTLLNPLIGSRLVVTDNDLYLKWLNLLLVCENKSTFTKSNIKNNHRIEIR